MCENEAGERQHAGRGRVASGGAAGSGGGKQAAAPSWTGLEGCPSPHKSGGYLQ